MTKVDQFESVFKAADKKVFHHEAVKIAKATLITDLPGTTADGFAEKTQHFLRALGSVEWNVVRETQFRSVDEMLKMVEENPVDLICTYRNLHSNAWRHPYSLGEHLDVLTQCTETPILVLPHPGLEDLPQGTMEDTSSVMVITDHLTGDDHLVSFGVHFTQKDGTLRLTHIEDQARFDAYLEVISKISSIDTEEARESILHQLLKEPHDYVTTCQRVLAEEGLSITIEETVTLGHHLSDHQRLIEQHKVDLLVMNTKEDDQLAMHGLAYPLAVELRRVPLLML